MFKKKKKIQKKICLIFVYKKLLLIKQINQSLFYTFFNRIKECIFEPELTSRSSYIRRLKTRRFYYISAD